MTTAYTTLRTRLGEVIEQTLQVVNRGVMGGHVTNDEVPDKVQHLINLVQKFASVADAQAQAPASFTDHEAAPTSAHVDVVNVVNLPPAPQIKLDMDAVETRPQLAFVQLSCGRVNLFHVSFLDTEGDFLYLAGGAKIKLKITDTKRLDYYLKLYKTN